MDALNIFVLILAVIITILFTVSVTHTKWCAERLDIATQQMGPVILFFGLWLTLYGLYLLMSLAVYIAA